MRLADLDKLLPNFMSSQQGMITFMNFLKLQFNSSVLQWESAGNKDSVKSMKKLLRNIFKFCEENEQYNGFIRMFIIKGVFKAALKSIQIVHLRKLSYEDLFSDESLATEVVNPFLLKFATTYLLKESKKNKGILMEDNILANLHSANLCLVFAF
jgi:hypothetical protein